MAFPTSRHNNLGVHAGTIVMNLHAKRPRPVVQLHLDLRSA
jgi:hypothetical protein